MNDKIGGELTSGRPDVKKLPKPEINFAHIDEEHRIILTEPPPGNKFTNALPHDTNHLNFDAGHSTGLYESGFGRETGQELFEITSPSTTQEKQLETVRCLRIDIDSLVSSESFRHNKPMQTALLTFIQNELGNSDLALARPYMNELRNLSEEAEKYRPFLEAALSGIKDRVGTISWSNEKIRCQAAQNFFNACREAGISIFDGPKYEETSQILSDNIRTMVELEAGEINKT